MSKENYVVEDEFDFWGELNKDDNEFIFDDTYCLLSKEPLGPNHVALPCGHKFNYVPLCREITNLKYPSRVYTRTINLHKEQICCPYCRTIFDKLLPKIPLYNLVLPNGICSNINCIVVKQCSHTTCESISGFDTDYGVLCAKHYSKFSRKPTKKHIAFEDEESNRMFKENTVPKLKEQLLALNLPASGLKRDLVDRLVKHKKFLKIFN